MLINGLNNSGALVSNIHDGMSVLYKLVITRIHTSSPEHFFLIVFEFGARLLEVLIQSERSFQFVDPSGPWLRPEG